MSTRRIVSTAVAACLGALSAFLLAGLPVHLHAADKLVYADFELPLDQRPISTRGGLIQLFGFQESQGHPMQFKGMDGQTPPAPAIKMTAKDGFEQGDCVRVRARRTQSVGGVSVEIHGLPDKDGKPQFDDVSTYKFLDLQIFHRRADEDASGVQEPGRRCECRATAAVRLSHQGRYERLQDQIE